ARDVASTLELQPLLGLLLAKLRDLVGYDVAALFVLEGGDRLRLMSYQGPRLERPIEPLWSLDGAAHYRAVIAGRHPVIVPDVAADEPLAQALRGTAERYLSVPVEWTGTWMGVPLIVRDQVIGLLAVTHRTAGQYSPQRAELAQAFALQAAIAIENARLFEAAQDKAALEERQKLARELHDSVSQALYGIALGARTARNVIEREPARAIGPIDYVLNLAEAGLAEMRALIFELRPESLAQEGLAAALAKHAAALHARHGLDVKCELDGEPDLPLNMKQDLYRIAQEALHNVVKHAQARSVRLALRREGSALTLEVRDDGVGFDAERDYAGHLGQRSMRERAEGLGARYSAESAPGEGSTIRVSLTLPPQAAPA
ncbi:MAG TPA: GAF domain-containing sensor histidine kinase, partial [Deinococcales bacterium]|nr:GAF domain-containing sensor histidine kinase [Deinococcales bacterium]